MENDDFIKMAQTYGANIVRWPEEMRDNARRMFAANLELMVAVREFDEKLDGYKMADNDTRLLDRIMRQVESGAGAETAEEPDDVTPAIPDTFLFIFNSGWVRTATLMLCALFGLFLGVSNLSLPMDIQDSPIDMDHEIFGSTTINEVLP